MNTDYTVFLSLYLRKYLNFTISSNYLANTPILPTATIQRFPVSILNVQFLFELINLWYDLVRLRWWTKMSKSLFSKFALTMRTPPACSSHQKGKRNFLNYKWRLIRNYNIHPHPHQRIFVHWDESVLVMVRVLLTSVKFNYFLFNYFLNNYYVPK